MKTKKSEYKYWWKELWINPELWGEMADLLSPKMGGKAESYEFLREIRRLLDFLEEHAVEENGIVSAKVAKNLRPLILEAMAYASRNAIDFAEEQKTKGRKKSWAKEKAHEAKE